MDNFHSAGGNDVAILVSHNNMYFVGINLTHWDFGPLLSYKPYLNTSCK